jgi:hypothetical protein
MKKIAFTLPHVYKFEECGCEIYLKTRHSFLFDFTSNQILKKIYENLKPSKIKLYENGQQFLKENDVIKKWQNREISNYEYLVLVNVAAGRSFNDVDQYIIFPWILNAKSSLEHFLNLEDESIFRDLKKPIAAQSEELIAHCREYYDIMATTDICIPYCFTELHLSGQHLCHCLARMEPLTSDQIKLHSFNFD